MMRRTVTLLLPTLTCLFLFCRDIYAWQAPWAPKPPRKQRQHHDDPQSRLEDKRSSPSTDIFCGTRGAIQKTVASAILATTLFGGFVGGGDNNNIMIMTAMAETPPMELSDFQKQVQKSLNPATEDRPAIPLPKTGDSNAKVPLLTQVQSLISLSNPNVLRPLPTDVLVIQVFASLDDLKTNSNVLGGAKIPVAKLAKYFPVRLVLGSNNGVKSSLVSWDDVLSNQDVYVQATICNEGSELPCRDPFLQGLSISKLLPANAQSDMPALRLPASILLELPKEKQ